MLAEVHILKRMYIYKKGSPSNISIFPDMYGYVGGKKEGRQYPTVANVREKFYEMHKDAARDPDPELGQIPLVQHSTFRLCFDPDPQLSGALVTKPLVKFHDLKGKFGALDCHAGKEFYQNAMVSMENFIRVMEGKKDDIRNTMSAARAEQAKRNRDALVSITDTVLFLAKQNIPFRGDKDETGVVDSEGKDPSNNDGNFRASLRMRIRSGDSVLIKHCESVPKNATMMSADIQNEIMEVVKTMVLERILTNVAKAEFWTIIADDTTDRSKKELTAICIRYLQQDAGGVYIIKEDPVAVA